MHTKSDMLVIKVLNETVKKQIILAKSSCILANKTLISKTKLDKIVAPELKLTFDVEKNNLVKNLEKLNESIISASAQSIQHFAKAKEYSLLFDKENEKNKMQELLSKIIRETKLTAVSQQIATDAFNIYLKLIISL